MVVCLNILLLAIVQPAISPSSAEIVPVIVADDATNAPALVTENCGVTPPLPKAIPSVPTYIPAVVLDNPVLPL